jgi:hypothetical protein
MSRAKLSPEARQLIDAAAPDHSMVRGRSVTDVLIRTTREVSTDDRVALESLGAIVRTVAGDILTANVPVDRLTELADLEVVAYVEVSRALPPEVPSTPEERRMGEER